MGLREYRASQELCLAASSYDANAFYSLLMATMRVAGSSELDRLGSVFPETVQELRLRYNEPGGVLPRDSIK